MKKIRLSAVRQDGIASIIVVFVITILLSLISLGFARLMDRALQNVSNNQLGAAADYAAQSGLNDAIAFVKANQATNITDCSALTQTGTAFGDFFSGKVKLTTDGNTKYTCVLVNPVPGDLAFQNIPPYNSQVVKLASAGSASLNQLMFSWQATTNPTSKVPFGSGSQFLTERAWGQGNRPPVLRITLYPISGTTVPVPSQTRTYYLYPRTGASVGSVNYSTTASGNIIGGGCGAAPSSPFTNTNYQCNVVINNLASATYYEARITPLYAAADVGIQGIDGGGTTKFKDAQSVIDVTGKSNAAVKRIQARVALGDASDIIAGNNSIPEDAIRSANTICKRLISPSDPLFSSRVFIDPGSSAVPECNFVQSTLPPLDVTLTANPTSVLVGGNSNLTWTVSGIANSCTATNDGGLAGWTGGKAATGGGPENSGALNSVRTYNFNLTCSNITGQSNTASASVRVNQPAPTVNLTASPTSVAVGSSSTLTWTTSNSPTSCTATGDWSGGKATGGGSQSTGSLNTARTYNYTLTCSNSGGSNFDSATVTANAAPTPPPPPPGSPPPPPLRLVGRAVHPARSPRTMRPR
ncbi:hypothetical protein HY379_00670 [Candidatus Saccharibacteria bacterium]|nr:hypothetical protein [Candidatus Saccharibacteria bacterium]